MDEGWAPKTGVAVGGREIPAVAHLDWYLPKLSESRTHDLSQSGLQMEWDWEKLLAGQAADMANWWKTNRGDPRDLVAQLEGIDPARVVCCNGATQGVNLALMAAISRGETPPRVAVEMPSYAPVTQVARLLGCETVAFHRRPIAGEEATANWRLERSELEEIIPTVSALLITPVLNPLGWPLADDDRQWLVETCRQHGVTIIADEVYDYALKPSNMYKPFHAEGEHCVSVNSLTKCHGMGHLRFGWIIANEEIAANAMRAFRNSAALMPSPTITMVAAAWPHLDQAIERIAFLRRENLPHLVNLLAEHNIAWTPPPAGLFGAFPLPNGARAVDVIETLGKKYDLLATPGEMFDDSLANWLRVAWTKEPEQFRTDLVALDSLLRELKG